MTRAIARDCRRILCALGWITSTTAPVGFAVVFLLAVASCACMAQEALTPAALVKGVTVRLQWTAESGPTRGTVGAQEADYAGFLLRPSNGGAARRVALSDVRSIEVLTNRDSRWTEGMLAGLAVGAIMPYLAPGSQGDVDLRPLASVVLGSLGAVLGAAIGYTIAAETWSPVKVR
jgi:hypothetical protein